MRLKNIYLGLLLGLFVATSGALNINAQEQSDTLSYLSAVADTLPGDTIIADSTLTEQENPISALSAYAMSLFTRFKKSPLLIGILYLVILYSIVTLITLLIIILINRRRLEREELLKEYLLELFQQLLMNYLFEEEKREDAFEELNRVADNRVNRQILIDQMIAICDFEGIPYQMSPELIDRAWANMFVRDEVIVK